MSKTEVEKNEEGIFKKWRNETDTLLEAWLKNAEKKTNREGKDPLEEQEDEIPKDVTKTPRSPTYFEHNIEVWRQLYVLDLPALSL